SMAVATNGEEALATARFDIVLMDLQMPVLDGISAIRRLRTFERAANAPRIPVIALSANAMTHQVAEALEAGADAHVAKPIDIEKLIATIDDLCNGTSRAQRGAAEGPREAKVVQLR